MIHFNSTKLCRCLIFNLIKMQSFWGSCLTSSNTVLGKKCSVLKQEISRCDTAYETGTYTCIQAHFKLSRLLGYYFLRIDFTHIQSDESLEFLNTFFWLVKTENQLQYLYSNSFGSCFKLSKVEYKTVLLKVMMIF